MKARVARWRKVVHVSISLLVQITFCNQNSAFLCLTLLQFQDQHTTIFGHIDIFIHYTSYVAKINHL